MNLFQQIAILAAEVQIEYISDVVNLQVNYICKARNKLVFIKFDDRSSWFIKAQ